MHAVHPKKCNTKLSIKIENSFITQVTKTKFLGIIIDEKLNWKDHILYISNKISKATGVIIKARMMGKRALLSLYYSLVYPYLTYCCQVWGATYLYNIEILNKLQKKSHTNNMFTKQVCPHRAIIQRIENIGC